MIKRSFFIFLCLSLVGCASVNPYYLGMDEFYGDNIPAGISSGWAKEGDKTVERFHLLIIQTQYEKAYEMLSIDLKMKWSFDNFRTKLRELDKQYGQETNFLPLKYLVANFSHLKKGLGEDPFKKYQHVLCAYRSFREKNVDYKFDLVRESGTIKIRSLSFEEVNNNL